MRRPSIDVCQFHIIVCVQQMKKNALSFSCKYFNSSKGHMERGALLMALVLYYCVHVEHWFSLHDTDVIVP